MQNANASERASSGRGSKSPSSFLCTYPHHFLSFSCELSRSHTFLSPHIIHILFPSTSLMLDTSQSYLPLRRGSSDDDFEQSPPLVEEQQYSPPRWRDILLIISGVTNIAALCLILSYLFFPSSSTSPPAVDLPASKKCSAATTAYPQTSYSKQNLPSVTWGEEGRWREGGGEEGARIWKGSAIIILTLNTNYVSGNPHIP